jgi:glycosyltransferase involved in cell wall biosynthesis
MKLLIVPKEFPHSKVIGGPILVYNRIKYLSRNHQVGLASFMREEDRQYLSSIKPYLSDLELMPYPPPRSRFKKISDFLFSEVPPYMCNTKSPRMRKTIAEMTRRGDYDVVITEYSVMGQYIHRNPEINPQTKRVVSCHECYTIARKKVRDHYGVFSRRGFEAMMDLRGLESYEFEMYRQADKVLTLTPEEQVSLLKYDPTLDIEVVPHGVDIQYFMPRTEQGRETAVGFLGNYPHDPNRDAVMYFLTEMWGELKRRVLGIKLYVIGRGPTEDVLAAAQEDSDIIVTGQVDDVREYLEKVKVFVAPIRLGKGFRGKILEAMAMGIPVVSTRLGAEGMAVRDGDNIMLAETPGQFIRSTEELLQDEELHRRVGINGRRLVEENYSWQKGVEILERVLERLVLQEDLENEAKALSGLKKSEPN